MTATFAQVPIPSGKHAVQLLDELQKFLPILFHRDFGAKLLNAVTFRLVHKTKRKYYSIRSRRMFDVERSAVSQT
jgi:hypothetical protein